MRHSWNLTIITERTCTSMYLSANRFQTTGHGASRHASLPAIRDWTCTTRITKPLIDRLNRYQRRMVVVGPLIICSTKYTKDALQSILPGLPKTSATRRFRACLSATSSHCSAPWTSKASRRCVQVTDYLRRSYHLKRLKKFLRRHPPVEHWHVAGDGQVADLFGSTDHRDWDGPVWVLRKIAPMMDGRTEYPRTWGALSRIFPQTVFPYSEMSAIGKVINHLPTSCSFTLANSSCALRPTFPSPNDVEVLSNRGTNGIEGSLSTAIGYATASDKLNFIFIGDLSFLLRHERPWNANYGSNVRILLLNNEGEKYSIRASGKWK